MSNEKLAAVQAALTGLTHARRMLTLVDILRARGNDVRQEMGILEENVRLAEIRLATARDAPDTI